MAIKALPGGNPAINYVPGGGNPYLQDRKSEKPQGIQVEGVGNVSAPDFRGNLLLQLAQQQGQQQTDIAKDLEGLAAKFSDTGEQDRLSDMFDTMLGSYNEGLTRPEFATDYSQVPGLDSVLDRVQKGVGRAQSAAGNNMSGNHWSAIAEGMTPFMFQAMNDYNKTNIDATLGYNQNLLQGRGDSISALLGRISNLNQTMPYGEISSLLSQASGLRNTTLDPIAQAMGIALGSPGDAIPGESGEQKRNRTNPWQIQQGQKPMNAFSPGAFTYDRVNNPNYNPNPYVS